MTYAHTTGTNPLLKEGDVIGKLTITKYVGRFKPISKRTGEVRKYFAHHYDLVCECGNEVLGVQQETLRRTDRPRRMCEACAHIERKKARRNRKPKQRPRFFHPEWPVLPCDLERTRGVGR